MWIFSFSQVLKKAEKKETTNKVKEESPELDFCSKKILKLIGKLFTCPYVFFPI